MVLCYKVITQVSPSCQYGMLCTKTFRISILCNTFRIKRD